MTLEGQTEGSNEPETIESLRASDHRENLSDDSSSTHTGTRSGLSESQNPTITDALSYLELVKAAFRDRPHVYTQFLDTMKDFRSRRGFGAFLPSGYSIESAPNAEEGVLLLVTPSGTSTVSLQLLTGNA
ncbi:uncharacterized protein EI90DRAFT_3047501 [Cantharellus anzutake]|uniref:uncharacterized protein n=1 Tax=Cantharellus anzutake TaxID=1750568 RepID=UPI0019083F42|nr:uncharacterized protein EI90DRAFT_3047501 [Cantharellus anzutake]KAF8335908.1 hypothetical protein EI90DRAFT_3047501 [Cantharellus anzutake]